MSFFKNVWSDLVERRLWPVAVGLVIALVALPVALGRGGGETTVAPAAAPAPQTAVTPETEVVSLTTAKAKGAPLGHAHNPFKGLGQLVAAAATGTSPTVTAAPPANPAAVGGAPAGGGGGDVPVPTEPSTPPPSNNDITSPAPPSNPSNPVDPGNPAVPAKIPAGYRVDLTYGRSGDTNKRSDVARLSPLTALGAPIALFVGTKDDQNTAIFMILGDVAASGDGTCRPSPSDCQVLGLHPGDAEFFDVAASDGTSKRYELQVDKISRKIVGSTRASITSRHRESRAGRGLLHSALSTRKNLYVAKYRYALAKGVVTKVMPAAR